MNATLEQQYQDEDWDIRQMVLRLWRGRMLIAICVVACGALFTVAAFMMTPIYRASAVLVPASGDPSGSLGKALGSLGSLAAIAGVDLNGRNGTATEEALAVLRSREFTEGFITDHNLLPVLFAAQWDSTGKRWKVAPDKQPTLAQGYKRFDKIRIAMEDKKTGLIRVQIEWKNREQAAQWVNDLTARLNTVMRARAIRRTDAYLGYLQKELAGTSAVETRTAIGRLMESQINDRMLANVTEEYAFRVVDRALVPDRKDPVRPKKALLIAAGLVGGAVLGVIAVLILGAVRGDEPAVRRSLAARPG